MDEEFKLVGDEEEPRSGGETTERYVPPNVAAARDRVREARRRVKEANEELEAALAGVRELGRLGLESPVRLRKQRIARLKKEAAKQLEAQRKAEVVRVAAERWAMAADAARKEAGRQLASLLLTLADAREAEEAVQLDIFLWSYRKRQARRQLLHDAREHEEANLAGVSHD